GRGPISPRRARHRPPNLARAGKRRRGGGGRPDASRAAIRHAGLRRARGPPRHRVTAAAPARSGAVESFSTEALMHGGRTLAWNAIYSSQLATADFIPRHEDFSAGLELGGLGQLCLARLITGPCTIRRTAEHIGAS